MFRDGGRMQKRVQRLALVGLLQEVVRLVQAEPSYRSVVQRIRSTEHRYSQEVGDEVEKRIMRVETARMLFHAAIDKGAAFHTVKRRFLEVLSLPSRYLPFEVATYLEFAAYCERQGRTSAAIRLLEWLEADLRRRKGSVSRGVLGYCRGKVAYALRQMRKK
jgi:hypothetical protein